MCNLPWSVSDLPSERFLKLQGVSRRFEVETRSGEEKIMWRKSVGVDITCCDIVFR